MIDNFFILTKIIFTSIQLMRVLFRLSTLTNPLPVVNLMPLNVASQVSFVYMTVKKFSRIFFFGFNSGYLSWLKASPIGFPSSPIRSPTTEPAGGRTSSIVSGVEAHMIIPYDMTLASFRALRLATTHIKASFFISSIETNGLTPAPIVRKLPSPMSTCVANSFSESSQT